MDSFKKSSNRSFIVFIVSILLTILFSSRSSVAIRHFDLYGYYLYKLLGLVAVLATIISFVCIVCYEICSKQKIDRDKEELKRLYNANQNYFLRAFKTYIALGLQRNSNSNYDSDIKYLLSVVTKYYTEYKENVLRILNSLSSEDCYIGTDIVIPEYIEKLYNSINEGCLPVEEFIHTIKSSNDFLYVGDSRYVDSDRDRIYMLNDLFMDKMMEINIKANTSF